MLDSLNSPYIHAADSDNFTALVIDNSAKGPVLVNFWSRKAGPCLRLYPVLDQLTHQYAGRFLLINVDTDAEFKFTREYGISSVPTLKLFRHGKVIETLHGYQSAEDLSRMLDRHVARDSDKKITEALTLYSQGQPQQAYTLLAEAIVDDPKNPRLPLAVTKLLKHEGRFAEALQLLDSLPAALQELKEIDCLRAELGFFAEFDSGLDLNTEPVGEGAMRILQQRAIYHVMQGEYGLAFEHLALMIDQDKAYADNYPQTAMLRLFKILQEGDPLIGRYRPLLRRYTH